MKCYELQSRNTSLKAQYFVAQALAGNIEGDFHACSVWRRNVISGSREKYSIANRSGHGQEYFRSLRRRPPPPPPLVEAPGVATSGANR